MPELSYAFRLGFLLLALALLAGDDWRRNGAAARRWRDYLFLFATGVCVVLCVVGFDAALAVISRDYFFLVKDLQEDAPFYPQLLKFSIKGSLPWGFVIGAMFLFANTWKAKAVPLSRPRLFRYVLYPIMCTIVISPLIAALFVSADPLGTGKTINPLYPKEPERVTHVLAAQGVNFGLYLGALIGTLWAISTIRKGRETTPAVSAPLSIPPPAQADPSPP